MGLFLVLLGPPGVGKGTQAVRIAKRLGEPHVSSGNLFREAFEEGTQLGIEAQRYIGQGKLVPDALTIQMVAERLSKPDCAEGVVLDGFPRTIEQAKALDGILARSGVALSLVVYLQACVESLMQRLGGRWTCRDCQAVYHTVFSPPRVPGRCDVCGGELYQRADDTTETHRKRIEVYLEQTAPLIEFYRARGLLVNIDAEQDIAGVEKQLLRAVRRVKERRTK